jgi:N-hydroxyarylamine O-acetyltransferase
VNGAWTRVYRFDLDPQYDADYEMANYFVSAYPQSIFLHNLLAARLAPGKRFGLFNRRFSAHDEREGSDHRELESIADLRRVLENELGIRLPDDAGLDAALARLP